MLEDVEVWINSLGTLCSLHQSASFERWDTDYNSQVMSWVGDIGAPICCYRGYPAKASLLEICSFNMYSVMR